MAEFTVRKRADQLREGDQFIFDEEMGGEGEVVTVVEIGVMYGLVQVETQELDFDLEMLDRTMVSIQASEEEVHEA